MSINNVSRSDVIERLSKELKKVSEVKPPAWAAFVKTGAHTERPPMNPDWWYVRAASLLTKVSDLGPIGVAKLRVKYGGKRNRGMAPERFKRGGGKILRLLLQQLEKAGFLKQATKGVHKGRVLTPGGVSFVDKVSYQLMKENNVVLPQKVVAQQHQSQAHAASEVVPAEKSEVQNDAPAEQKSEESVKKPRAPRKPRKKAEEVSAPVEQKA